MTPSDRAQPKFSVDCRKQRLSFVEWQDMQVL
ncbi:Protein of unknown function [Pyronema omphalodes CBS 100304]|uniref:Uncharacterized protein n=1 Tax=Pyronema omphalodes (strain CBS 100304) TaxID=1076935 RepID=U4KVY5_PYROM|nr:Protein of unknown function [Pyronema omphalodes CBS 100304]